MRVGLRCSTPWRRGPLRWQVQNGLRLASDMPPQSPGVRSGITISVHFCDNLHKRWSNHDSLCVQWPPAWAPRRTRRHERDGASR